MPINHAYITGLVLSAHDVMNVTGLKYKYMTLYMYLRVGKGHQQNEFVHTLIYNADATHVSCRGVHVCSNYN